MDVVMLANAWKARHDNPTSKHWIALELARAGHRVIWLEGAGMRRPSMGSGSDRSRIRSRLARAAQGAVPVRRDELLPGTESGGIHVLAPLLVPLPRYRLVRWVNGRLYARAVRRWARKFGMRDPVLINYVPVLADVMRVWPWRKVYHCVDRWDAFETYDTQLMSETDADCCRCADVVIASARELAERCRRYSDRVHLVMHGVDVDNFRAAFDSPSRPGDLPEGRLVGFFGLLSEWIDQDLLLSLAKAIAPAHLVLIGKEDVDISRLSSVGNVVLLGPRPFRDLAAYVAFFDAGIIPFHVNDLTRSVNPVKLREMLAGGCPVVSTALPEVMSYRELRVGGRVAVSIADNHDAFVAGVQRFMENPFSLEERQRIGELVADETWRAKTGEIIRILDGIERGGNHHDG